MDREQLEAEMEAERERKGEGAGEGLEEYEAAEDGVEEEIEEDKGGNDDVSWIAYVFGVTDEIGTGNVYDGHDA